MTRDADGHSNDAAPRETLGALPEPGEIFDGKYRIEREIGRGAMAAVFEATHLQLEDRVAIKLLLPRWAENPELVERFMREGRASTRIRSEHVVRVFDVGVSDARPYLVMEYLDGSDLDQVLAEGGALPVPVAIDYLLQACEAIAEAHVLGIIHRDLKPANLFLTRRADASACVKVLDFGISKVTPSVNVDTRTTAPSTVMGSPQYMSPEQLLSSTDVDARSDVWSLGAILHELLVASPPFDGDTFAALSAAVLRDPAPHLTALRADVPPAIEAVVLRCLEKEPSRRFADVAALSAALGELGSPSARASAERIARVLDGGTGKVSVPPPRLPKPPGESAVALLGRATPPPPRARGRALGYVVAAIAFVGVGSGIVWMVVRDERAAEQQGNAAESAEAGAAPASVPTLTNGASAATGSPSFAPTSGSASPSARAPTDGTSTDGGGRGRANALSGGAQGTPLVPARPANHGRWPRRGPHANPGRVPPLPDFPIPGADPQGEPSSRPILATPPPSPPPSPEVMPPPPAPAASASSAP